MFSLAAMSSRRRSSRVSLTSSSMTACDCFSVKIGDEESISEPQESIGLLQSDAREFLQPVAAQSMHEHRIVSLRVCHRDERVTAARRGEPFVLFGQVDALDERNARAALHAEKLHIRNNTITDEHSRVTRAQLINPCTPVSTRCASRHSLPLRLSATSKLLPM